jgi:hypothetical protein
MPDLLTQTFRYRGRINWKKIYTETKRFFHQKRYDFYEPTYKDKVNEFEGTWRAELDFDEVNRFVFKIEFKLYDLSPTAETYEDSPVYNGKMWMQIVVQSIDHYGVPTFIGPRKIFTDKQTWLQKVYDQVTQQERWDKVYVMAYAVTFQYLDLLKRELNMETK